MVSILKGFIVAQLNTPSVVKKIDALRFLLHDSKIDMFTLSETSLQPHLQSDLVKILGFMTLRLDRVNRGKRKKGERGGGLVTYVRDCHSSLSEHLLDLNVSNEDIEAQWVLVHRPKCKNVVVCNIYRPPGGKRR